ncbi:glycoside hydrolase family 10 protein [Fervidobacterium thailandense]|uniref:glycoside hydrolase family 10 protein n=1 Tax=Fervidobacterium thailandense TaxID=1008305 RepID=UPI000845BF29|nr:family 10 glycosylhydrolase [Fervidobacterium thailandense]
MRHFTLSVLLLLFFSLGLGNLINEPGLSIWVVRDQITSPDKVQRVVNLAVEMGVNRLYVQVVGRMDAYYKSNILPRAEVLEKQPETFDPLGMIIELAKPYNIKISAWMNTFYAWPFTSRPKDPNHVVNRFPEWVTYDASGVSLLNYTRASGFVEGIFLDPGVPEVRNYVASIAEEIAANYDVDEIHLDFIRYPYRHFGYNPIALENFQRWLETYSLEIGKEITPTEEEFNRFRILQVNLTVEEIYRRVKKYGKNLSAAVFGNYASDGLPNRFQDWVTWLKDGYLDYACLMAYSPYISDVVKIATAAERRVGSLSRVRIGLGVYTLKGDHGLLKRMMETVMELRPNEIVLFSFADLQNQSMRNVVSTISASRERRYAMTPEAPETTEPSEPSESSGQIQTRQGTEN